MTTFSILWCQLAARVDRGEDGASLVEYAFLVGLIAMVALSAVSFFGASLNNLLNNIGSAI
ncbi:MAG: Flp/Fap pilin component [Acidimicrobiales bacterium]|nr:Flp/Fap pilin component [Acidimicrobiales bacterium]